MGAAVTDWLSIISKSGLALAVAAFPVLLGLLVGPVFLQSKSDKKKQRLEEERARREREKEEREAKQIQHNMERDRAKDQEAIDAAKKAEGVRLSEVLDNASRSLASMALRDRVIAIEVLRRVIEADADEYGPAVLRALCLFLKKSRSQECLETERLNCSLSDDVRGAVELVREQTNKHGGTFGEVLDLRRAQLRDAKWTHVKLPGATLFGANMDFAELFEADFTGANLQNANLEKATFKSANFTGANLTDACLKNIRSSRDADFSCADLARAELHGADLANVRNLTSDQIRRAFGDERTRLPANVTPPRSWLE